MLQILLETPTLIALNKPSGIPVQPGKDTGPCLLHEAEAHCGHTLFVVHRIDQPVSGITVFAKSPSAAALLSAQFSRNTTVKEYLAAVTPPLVPEAGTLVHFFEKNEKGNKSTAFPDTAPGRVRGELEYRTAATTDRYTLLHIRLHSGRHHQIRAQLAAVGSPIKGDVKYGARRKNHDRSIHLHAWKLELDVPGTGKRVQLEASVPEGDALWAVLQVSI